MGVVLGRHGRRLPQVGAGRKLGFMWGTGTRWLFVATTLMLACSACGSEERGGGSKGPTGSIDVNEVDPPPAYVIITTPGARPGVTVSSSPITLGGMVGDVPTMTGLSWETDHGDSGGIALAEEWQSEPIEIPPGDTEFTIRGTLKSGVELSDRVSITLNPGIGFASPLWMTPPIAFAGETVDVTFSINLDTATPADAVTIVRVDDRGRPTESVTSLSFDGEKWSGSATLSTSEPGAVRLRAEVTSGTQSALSETVEFKTYERPSDSKIERARALLNEVADRYDGWITSGFSKQQAREKLAGFLHDQDDVVWFDPGTRGELFSWELDSGFNQIFTLRPAGVRARPTVGKPTARINESFLWEWLPQGANLGDTVGPKILLQLCPRYGAAVTTNAKVADYHLLKDNALLVFSSHGDGGGIKADTFGIDKRYEVIYTEEEDTGEFAYPVEKAAGQIVTAGGYDILGRKKVFLGVTSKFIAAWTTGLPKSIVFAATCNSAVNGLMAAAFLGAGAKTYVGATGLVGYQWGSFSTRAFFQALMDGETVEDAQKFMIGSDGKFDPDWTSTRFRVFGQKDITATGLCEGKTTFNYKYDGPNGTVEIKASSIEKVMHMPSFNALLARHRQMTCEHHQLASNGTAGLDGLGQLTETYGFKEAYDKQLVKVYTNPPVFFVDPDLNQPDWVNYTSFGAGQTDQYADRCEWSFAPTSPTIADTEWSANGLKIDRGVGSGSFDSGTLLMEFTFPDKFIAE